LTSFIISDNVQFVSEVWDNMHNWMDNPKKRKAAIKMLKEFKSMTHNQYWLTDDEELFIDQISHMIESCC
jgi:hypothetical protein